MHLAETHQQFLSSQPDQVGVHKVNFPVRGEHREENPSTLAALCKHADTRVNGKGEQNKCKTRYMHT